MSLKSSAGFYKWEKKIRKQKERMRKLPELKQIPNQKSQTPADQQEIWFLKDITPTRTHKYSHIEQSQYTVGNES